MKFKENIKSYIVSHKQFVIFLLKPTFPKAAIYWEKKYLKRVLNLTLFTVN